MIRKLCLPVSGLLLIAVVGGCAERPAAPVTRPFPAPVVRSAPVAPSPHLVLRPSAAAPRCVRYSEEGLASWYGRKYQGRRTASGERFNMNALTAAHRDLPFGTQIDVTNLENGRTVSVVVNDRGPQEADRVLDLSRRAADTLGFLRAGLAHVLITGQDCG